MSGIYIRGMEMPTTPVLFCIHPDGKVFADLEGSWREYKAVFVPPHGRLIDADSMEKEVCGGCVHGEHKYASCIDCALANAPTIIPCEGG